jgi:hypothetical protein
MCSRYIGIYRPRGTWNLSSRRIEIRQNSTPLAVAIELDASEVHPLDPGQGTPVLVRRGNKYATLPVALDYGWLGDEKLTQSQLSFLRSWEPWTDEWLDQQYEAHPDYSTWKGTLA